MKIFFSLCFLIFFVSCQSPTKSIQKDIETFKKDYPDHFVSYQGSTRKMQFAWSGDITKRPLLFIHGSPGSWEGWSQFLLNSELQKKFHLIAVDRPGYGGSGSGDVETSIEIQSANVVRALESNHSGLPAIIIGHSLGGALVARIAMDYPEKVAGIIFVASSVDPSMEKIKWMQYVGRWWGVRSLIPTSLRVCNEEIFPFQGELEKMLPLWPKIKAPSVLIQGEEDNLVPPHNQDFLIEKLHNTKIVDIQRIQGLNHFVPWKRPDLILNGIRSLDEQIKKDQEKL